MRLFSFVLTLGLCACVSYPDGAAKLPTEGVLTTDPYVLPLTLDEVQSQLRRHEKFCGPFEDIEITGPKQGEWRKFTATLSGKTREVLVIKLNETEDGTTEFTGYAADQRWLPYTQSFVDLVDNVGNCSANV